MIQPKEEKEGDKEEGRVKEKRIETGRAMGQTSVVTEGGRAQEGRTEAEGKEEEDEGEETRALSCGGRRRNRVAVSPYIRKKSRRDTRYNVCDATFAEPHA